MNQSNPRDASLASLRLLAEQALSRAAGAPLVAGNRVKLLRDATENYPAWLGAIEGASRSITLDSYILADDKVGNTQVFDGGSIAFDNKPPAFTNATPDGTGFIDGGTALPLQVDVNDTGAGVNGSSVKVQVIGASSGIVSTGNSGATYTFALHGSDFLADGLQGLVNFNYVADDNLGNHGVSTPVHTVKVDRKPPVLVSAFVPDNTGGTNGFWPATGTISVTADIDDGADGSGAATAVTVEGAQTGTITNTAGTVQTFTFSRHPPSSAPPRNSSAVPLP